MLEDLSVVSDRSSRNGRLQGEQQQQQLHHDLEGEESVEGHSGGAVAAAEATGEGVSGEHSSGLMGLFSRGSVAKTIV